MHQERSQLRERSFYNHFSLIYKNKSRNTIRCYGNSLTLYIFHYIIINHQTTFLQSLLLQIRLH